MKNCDPFVFGPLLAIETIPLFVCYKYKKQTLMILSICVYY